MCPSPGNVAALEGMAQAQRAPESDGAFRIRAADPAERHRQPELRRETTDAPS